MGCNCHKEKTQEQKQQVWDKHIAGYNANQIAAQMLFHLACVREIIAGGDPSIVKKTKKKIKPIEEDGTTETL